MVLKFNIQNYENNLNNIIRLFRYHKPALKRAFISITFFAGAELIAHLSSRIPWGFPNYLFHGLSYFELALYIISAIFFILAILALKKWSVSPESKIDTAMPSSIKGPMPFGIKDGDLFKKLQRNDVVNELLDYILNKRSPLLVVWGPTGSGKTSLVYAGLSYGLAEHDTKVFYTEANNINPEKAILYSLQKSWGKDGFPPKSLEEILDLSSEQLLVIVIDQAEQLSLKDHAHLFNILRQAICAPPPYQVVWVVVFRTDFYGTWRQFEKEAGDKIVPDIIVKFFTVGQAEKIMSILAESSNIPIEHSLIKRIVNQCALNGEVQPSDIGIIMLILKKHAFRKDNFEMTLQNYKRIREHEGILDDYLQDCIDRLHESDRELAIRILMSLIDLNNNYRLSDGLSEGELESTIKLPLSTINRILNYLTSNQTRLLERLSASSDQEIRYRLSHEKLIAPVKKIGGIVEAEVHEATKILEQNFMSWKRNSKNSLLLKGRELRIVLKNKALIKWRETSNEKHEYINTSLRRRNLRRLLAGIACGFAFFVAMFIYQAYQKTLVSERLVSWGLPSDLCQKQSQLTKLGLAAPVTDLGWLKPGLKELTLEGPRVFDLKGIPDTVRDLTIKYAKNLFKLKGAPQDLKHLSIVGVNFRSSWEWPNNLESLTLKNTDCLRISKLPRSLKSLVIDNDYTEEGKDFDEGYGISVGKVYWFFGSIFKSKEDLPQGLRHCALDRVNLNNIKELPRNLDSLKLEFINIFSEKPDGKKVLSYYNDIKGLPPNLKELDLSLSLSNEKKDQFRYLPSTLKRLVLHGAQLEDLNCLPRGIETLELIDCDVQSWAGFPKKLNYLKITTRSKSILENLPNSVQDLELASCELDTLEGLPSSLKSLTLNRVWIKEEKNESGVLTARSISKNATETWDKLDKLPKGLRELMLVNMNVEEIPEFPEKLEVLHLWRSTITKSGALPRTLRTLILEKGSEINGIEDLPHQLHTLVIRESNWREIKDFPPNLSKCVFDKVIVNSDLLNLPDSLKSVTISGYNINNLNWLPPSVTELHWSAP